MKTQPIKPDTPDTSAQTVLKTILLTDLVDSTQLTSKYGDDRATEFFTRIDRMTRDLLDPHHGQEIDKTDGFLILFERPIDAVRYAQEYHSGMSALSEELGVTLKSRIGIHLGELIIIQNSEVDIARGAKPIEVEGLAKPQAARIMSLAMGGQTLMTRGAFDLARHGAVGISTDSINTIWVAHGAYLLKGIDELVEVFEVGIRDKAPLTPPPDTDKVKRSVAAGDEETLGWRPALGHPIPERKSWIINSKLGEGGFGEVWLVKNRRTGARRAFKFCFDAVRLRSLKRELTLFRLLRDALGDRKDISRLYDVQLEEAPFYLESDYTDSGSLIEWAESQGGINNVPLEERINLVSRTARAVGAAHSVGILHKDIKPGNILIYHDEEGNPRPRLADFGIGTLTDDSQLAQRNITAVGFTSVLEGTEHTTTQMYAPPETLAGKPFTSQGDIYSVGVLLYQMIVGDLAAPIAQGWEKDVSDKLLREDITSSIAGEPEDRLRSADELADRLQSLPQRRRAAMRKRLARGTILVTVILAALLLVSGAIIVRERDLKDQALYEKEKVTIILEFFESGLIRSADPAFQRANALVQAGREVTVASALDSMTIQAEEQFKSRHDVLAHVLQTIGIAYKNLSSYDNAERTSRRALELRLIIHSGDHAEIAESQLAVGDVLWFKRDYKGALSLYESSLEMRRRLFTKESAEVAESLNNMAACKASMKQLDEAEILYREALAIRQKLPEPFDRMLIAASQNNLGTCLRVQKKYDEAKQLFEEALDTARIVGGEYHYYVGKSLHNLARYLVNIENYEEAEERFREALEVKREALGDKHSSVADTEYIFARYWFDKEKLDEAEKHARKALSIRQTVLNPNHPELAESMELLVNILERTGQPEEAQPLKLNAQAIRDAISQASDKDE